METSTEGLRARKKRAARESIAATARRLFAERGYDAVTVVEIATAADVSEKTVFNHFATKEDLAFFGREARHERLLADLAERAPGASVLDVFRASTRSMLDELTGDDLARIVAGSRTLRERLATGWEEDAVALAAAIAETTGTTGDDIVPAVVARTLSWTHRAILGEALTGLLAGEDRGALAVRLRAVAERAYDQLAAGLGEYGG